MEAALEYLKGLSSSQRLMWIGNGGMAISGISTGVFGIQIVAGMNIYVFAVCAVLSILGWYGAQKDQQRKFELKMADAELREEKLRAGFDPNDDQTVIRVLDPD